MSPLCKTGLWAENLDAEDTIAFDNAVDTMARADLYRVICTVYGKPFGLTAFKEHVGGRCICAVEGKHG